MELRDKAFDHGQGMALGERRRLIEELMLFIPRLENDLESVKKVTKGDIASTLILRNIGKRSTLELVGDGGHSMILQYQLNKVDDIDSIEKVLEEFIGYEKEDLWDYARSIYAKELALGKVTAPLDSYTEELRSDYKRRDRCMTLSGMAPLRSFIDDNRWISMPSILSWPGEGGADSDDDGLTNYIEESLGTNVWSPDTDDDGLTDYEEVYDHFTDPLKRDTDSDGITDGDEIVSGTDPTKNETISLPYDNPFYDINDDTDNDGISDKEELSIGTDIRLQDSDRDGISDKVETELGTDPCSRDTDSDGVDDLKDLYPTDPNKGEGGINIHDDEEVLMLMYGIVAVGATVASFFGCSSCPSVAVKATMEILNLYNIEMEERRNGTDE